MCVYVYGYICICVHICIQVGAPYQEQEHRTDLHLREDSSSSRITFSSRWAAPAPATPSSQYALASGAHLGLSAFLSSRAIMPPCHTVTPVTPRGLTQGSLKILRALTATYYYDNAGLDELSRAAPDILDRGPRSAAFNDLWTCRIDIRTLNVVWEYNSDIVLGGIYF